MDFGLLERDYNNIIEAIKQFKEIEKAILFGSRALGNFKKASDIDLAIVGKTINNKTIIRLSAKLNEELPIPYFVDVIDYNGISKPNLIEHIDKFGKVLYSKK